MAASTRQDKAGTAILQPLLETSTAAPKTQSFRGAHTLCVECLSEKEKVLHHTGARPPAHHSNVALQARRPGSRNVEVHQPGIHPPHRASGTPAVGCNQVSQCCGAKPPDPPVPHTATDSSLQQTGLRVRTVQLSDEANSLNKTVLCVARLLPSVRKVVDRCTHTFWGVMEALLHFQPQRCHKQHTSHPRCCNCTRQPPSCSPNERSRTLACLGSTSPSYKLSQQRSVRVLTPPSPTQTASCKAMVWHTTKHLELPQVLPKCC